MFLEKSNVHTSKYHEYDVVNRWKIFIRVIRSVSDSDVSRTYLKSKRMSSISYPYKTKNTNNLYQIYTDGNWCNRITTRLLATTTGSSIQSVQDSNSYIWHAGPSDLCSVWRAGGGERQYSDLVPEYSGSVVSGRGAAAEQ